MGIDGIERLKPGDEEYHVVIVGRAGGHEGTNIYVVGPGTKRNAVHTGETSYRKERGLASNIQLVSKVAYSGNEIGCADFVAKLMLNIDQDHIEEVKA